MRKWEKNITKKVLRSFTLTWTLTITIPRKKRSRKTNKRWKQFLRNIYKIFFYLSTRNKFQQKTFISFGEQALRNYIKINTNWVATLFWTSLKLSILNCFRLWKQWKNNTSKFVRVFILICRSIRINKSIVFGVERTEVI